MHYVFCTFIGFLESILWYTKEKGWSGFWEDKNLLLLKRQKKTKPLIKGERYEDTKAQNYTCMEKHSKEYILYIVECYYLSPKTQTAEKSHISPLTRTLQSADTPACKRHEPMKPKLITHALRHRPFFLTLRSQRRPV